MTTNPSGGSKAIAIVDAYDDSTAAADLSTFDSQFGLPAANFIKIYGTGKPSAGCTNGQKPPSASGTGWDLEESLDIQWAHAMAPNAVIYLVEANSSSFNDLFNAVQVATACLGAGGGQQSHSWGGSEFSGETAYDKYFTGANVVYFASAGDESGVIYPSASPNVISIGGTVISRNQTTGAFQGQAAWYNVDWEAEGMGGPLGTGGGPSAFELVPSYQNGIQSIVGNFRGTPDLAADAAIASGVWVYSSTYCKGWCVVGGTSVASPVVAGIFNKTGNFYRSTSAALTAIYNGTANNLSVANVNSGVCGPPGSSAYPKGFGSGLDPQYTEYASGLAWNFCAGWGSPIGKTP